MASRDPMATLVALASDLPDVLRDSAGRHHAHLAQLIAGLRAIGIEEPAIRMNVDGLVESYRLELARTICEMAGAGHHV